MSNYPDGVSTRDIDRAACGEKRDPQDEEMKRADEEEDEEEREQFDAENVPERFDGGPL